MSAAAQPSAGVRRPSLTRQLLLWSLGALVLVWGSFVFMGYQTGVHEADELTDGHLASVAALLLNLRANELGEAPQVTPRVATPWLKSHDYQQSLSVVQWDAQGRLLHHSGSAPMPAFSAAEGFANMALGVEGVVWRSFSQWDAARERKVMVLLELRERDELAQDIAEQMIEPGLWLLPVVSLALGLALWRGLRPLYALSADVAALDPASTQRLASRHAWSEFESVVASINTLLDRQQAAMVRERRLANEVAHELRTPLSSIALQASALGGALDADARAQAIARIGQDALRAGHVLNQLLALARASRAELHEAKAPVDLCAVARQVCADFAQAAWQRGDDIALSAPQALWVSGHVLLLDIAARNLVENALKHTPDGTHIAVQVGASEGGGAWLQVCDDGARSRDDGPPAEGAGSPPDSLHLGHEILRRVADIHGGEFGTAPAVPPFTTCFRLDLPPSAVTPPVKITGYQAVTTAQPGSQRLPQPSTDPTTMPLVSMRELLDHAAANSYGIPAFNVNNLEQVQAVMAAADEVGAPVILQASAGARKYAGEPFIKHLIQAAVEAFPHIPLVMHQDHGTSPKVCAGAIDLGFGSVMMDGSLMEDGKTPSSFEYNVEVTRKVVDMAHKVGVTVEGELGCLGNLETGEAGEEDGIGAEGKLDHSQMLTDPEEAAVFVKATQLDALAIAIGTSHGAYKFSRKPTGDILAISRVKEIHKRIPNTHLVMHGSSSVPAELLAIINQYGGKMKETYGVPVEEIQEAIKHGVRKINIDTDIRLAMTGAVRKFLAENPDKFDAREWLKPAREAAKQVCKARYLEFGCEGQGAKIKGHSLQVVAALYASGALAQVVN